MHVFNRGGQRLVVLGNGVEVEPNKKERTKSQRKTGKGSAQEPQAEKFLRLCRIGRVVGRDSRERL